MLLDVVLVGRVFKAADVHLRTDTIDLCHTVGFPFLDPVDQTLHFLVVVPVGLQVVVVDEEFDDFRTILTGQTTGLTNIFEVAHIVLPVESIAAYVPCSIGISAGAVGLRVLQQIVAAAVVAATADSLVHQVPSLHLAAAGVHHALDPLVHSPDEGIETLLSCQGDSAGHIDVGHILGNSWCCWVALVNLNLERTDIGAFEVAVLDLLNAANLQADVIEIVLVGIGKLVKIESNALSRCA